jgi:hypothetical protein
MRLAIKFSFIVRFGVAGAIAVLVLSNPITWQKVGRLGRLPNNYP